MNEKDYTQTDKVSGIELEEKIRQYDREIRKLNREISHLKNAISHEKIAYTTILNQQKASTFLQREREKYLALLLANSPSIILFLSRTGRIEFCTDYFISKSGLESTGVIGYTLTEVLSPFLDADSHAKLIELTQDSTSTKHSVSFDVTFNFKNDGESEDFVGLIVPMNNERQNNDGTMLMFHDVTDIKRSREEALAASRAKSTFLSSMSHEIRTPMNAIIGMTLIGKNEKSLERKDYAFGKIESASTHLLGVINDILDISKIESGKMELSLIDFSFSQLIDRVKSVVGIKIQDKHQRFTVEIDQEIPDMLLGDDQRLAQVITNILSNATKFTPEHGDISFRAKLLSRTKDKCLLQISVKDSGIGISKQEQSKLFNIFQQAEAGTSRKYGGSGLGLAISRRILDLMGGEIWVESETGKGSCFFFTVNIGIKSDSISDTTITEKETEFDNDFSNKTILLVDDLDINLEIAKALLEPSNITIDTASSGKEALMHFKANPDRYDLILMDMQMPEIDGIEATKIIRGLGIPKAAEIPIIAMTANVFKEDIQKCLDAGMNNHLGKPMAMDSVMRMLAKYLKPKT